ncbi:hypothetical protein F4821DRAFT_23312 [Hypoxylon rubiginosum]|uniref:Uncharacterized protein n=1 Tax=Hypoxylon rubiginosum TaxID=110542 RepID=A0ACC0CMI8_9PEZI|nr:hypothetical protein F4821DRAFT_23312 [Hypoxylon rubiginosum]
MAIIEVIFPQIKNDAESVKGALEQMPVGVKAFKEAGALRLAQGFLSGENGKDVSAESREIVLLEWQTEAAFNDFINSGAFASFKAAVKPYSTGPPQLNLFETNEGAHLFGNQTIGLLLITPKDPANVSTIVGKIQSGLEKAAESGVVFGTSLNLPQKKIAIFRTFASQEELKSAKNAGSMQAIRADLGELAEITQLVTDVKSVPL